MTCWRRLAEWSEANVGPRLHELLLARLGGANGLYLSGSKYGERDPKRPGLELFSAIQCLLDQFATVTQAVAWAEESGVQLIEMEIGGKAGTGHLALADPSGSSAIIEFLDGKTSLHEGPEHTVMANESPYEEQVGIQQDYRAHGGDKPLPGGIESWERFARAAYYSALLPQTQDMRTATAYVFSVIRNASAPFGFVDGPDKPNISPTRWRTVTDCTEKRYFFESTTSPNVVWVELSQLDFDKNKGSWSSTWSASPTASAR